MCAEPIDRRGLVEKHLYIGMKKLICNHKPTCRILQVHFPHIGLRQTHQIYARSDMKVGLHAAI